MPKSPDDPAYLAKLQDYYARWRSLSAYGGAGAGLTFSGRQSVVSSQAAGFLNRSPDGRWTPTAPFFTRPLADAPVPAGLPMTTANSGDEYAIDAWLVRQPSRTVIIPVTGDSMIDAGIQPWPSKTAQ